MPSPYKDRMSTRSALGTVLILILGRIARGSDGAHVLKDSYEEVTKQSGVNLLSAEER